ncbi:metacaspase-3-like isoform X2 [Vigna umbellata]|uniref:metacaspase-3-like isoform X2 n=1 Tax=Vigna umbellata TaxID=87088 RepID=UPI001F5FED83|nr:metacaspase-3-like isoform X2 [Vigna umbellata]
MNKGQNCAVFCVCVYISFLLVAWLVKKTSFQTMDGRNKTRARRKGVPFPSNITATRCLVSTRINSSKRVEEHAFTCSGCRHKFILAKIPNAYRCYNCERVSSSSSSVSEQSTKDLGSFKRDHQPNSYNSNPNGTLQRTLSPSPSVSFSFSSPTHKRAVICGVSYGKRKFKLQGTINDVKNMKNLLLDIFKFPNECIRVLSEEKNDPNSMPTKKNILDSLNWLVSDCKSEGSLVFYFSGHGLQQPEQQKGDETDGLDETICPVDFLREGMITDNEINSIIVRPLKEGVKLHAIIDACHSGTTLDLVYTWKKEKGLWQRKENRSSHSKEKQTNGGVAICLSACDDAQVAADTAAFEDKYNGIMTYFFSKIIRAHPQITYGSLLEKMHEELGQIHQSRFSNRFLQRIFHRKIDQEPQLTSSEKFDIYSKSIAI